MSRSVLFRFLLVFARGAQIHRGYATMTPGRQTSRRKTKVLLASVILVTLAGSVELT
jgi:hypothetical protein